jgi:hypothetical protein
VTDKVTAADLLRQSGQTVTTSNPVLSLAQTWNAGGVTFTGLLFNATNTASASTSKLLDLQTDGVTRFAVGHASAAAYILTAAQAGVERFRVTSQSSGASVEIYSGGTGSFLGFGVPGSTDTNLFRDAANTLAMRNGTSAQALRIYNTFTDSSNYEMGHIAWQSNELRIGTIKAGTGSTRNLVFQTDGSSRWFISTAGHFLAAADNTYDIGASSSSRPKDIFVANRVVASGDLIAGGTGDIQLSGRIRMRSAGDGILALYNSAASDFSRLQFGGTTSSFPAIKRSGAAIHVRLADDSTYAGLECGAISAYGEVRSSARLHAYFTTAIPAGGTAGVGVRVSDTANFGVFFGSGAPTLSAAKGSLYLRSDGSGTGDRMYVNTDGSTAWTAVTTAT